MIHVIFDPGQEHIIPAADIEKAALSVLIAAGGEKADLSIVLTNDERIQVLNRDYRGIDAPTDVLSFTADEPDPETGATYFGDVIISCQRAEKQALAGGHSLVAEIQLLVIHGVLHLLGHDHDDPDEKARMWAAQVKALQTLDIPATILHE